MQNKCYDHFQLTDLSAVAKQLLEDYGHYPIWAFEAEMGAGKTTLILELLKKMGENKAEGSPTYSLVNTYDTPLMGRVFHFDLYRLNSLEEAFDIGIEEMIYGEQGLCLIEWPKKIEELLPEETIWLYLSAASDGSRSLEIKT